jgi:hypothetical protein
MQLTTARCSIITPLGWPVDPEVYMTYARCSGRVVRAASGAEGAPSPIAPRSRTMTVASCAGRRAIR